MRSAISFFLLCSVVGSSVACGLVRQEGQSPGDPDVSPDASGTPTPTPSSTIPEASDPQNAQECFSGGSCGETEMYADAPWVTDEVAESEPGIQVGGRIPNGTYVLVRGVSNSTSTPAPRRITLRVAGGCVRWTYSTSGETTNRVEWHEFDTKRGYTAATQLCPSESGPRKFAFHYGVRERDHNVFLELGWVTGRTGYMKFQKVD